MAVSYTHLLSAAETEKCKSLSAPHEQDDNAHIRFSLHAPDQPVSYTHLDVYKRQAVSSALAKNESISSLVVVYLDDK